MDHENAAAPLLAEHPVSPAGPVAIVVEDLTKRFGTLEAVSQVSFSVREGEVFAFLGPNGAGKSTTIKMLCTLSTPTSGRAQVAGYDVVASPRTVRRLIGLVFQERTLDEQLTAEENLRFHAVLYRVPRNEVESRIGRVLELVDLANRRKDLVSTYSGGMSRRLEIARALLHTPKVLFLDEPTIGLDPQTRAHLWEYVLRLRDEAGITVFMTTHYMDEAEVADRIGIIDHGVIAALDTPTGLKAAIGADTIELKTSDDDRAFTILESSGYAVHRTTEQLTVFVEDGESSVAPIISALGMPISHVRVHRPTLDDVFLHFAGREMREEKADNVSPMIRAWASSRSR